MKLNKKFTTGILLSASALALAGCSTGTIDDAVEEFDSIESGDIEVSFEVESDTYGEYGMNVTGQFEYVGDTEDADENKDQANAFGVIQKVNATELEEGEVEEGNEGEGQDGQDATVEVENLDDPVSSEDEELEEVSIEDLDLTDEEKAELEEYEAELISAEVEEGEDEALLEETDPSRDYNYQILEENRALVDGQETTSMGEIIALDDTMYDKVFLTGSEADGRFVYDSRDVGIMEYPISDFVTINPIIESFDIEGNDIEVESGDLHNGEKGHVFSVTPEQAVNSLQEENNNNNNLTQNIVGLVTEANVDTVIVGVNENSFSVEAISTGVSEEGDNPTSEADTEEDAETTDGEERVIGSLVITKTAGDVEIEEPTNAMDLDEFSSLVELFYQQQAEQQLEQQTEEGEVYGEDAKEFQEQQEQENEESTEEQEVGSEEQEAESEEQEVESEEQ